MQSRCLAPPRRIFSSANGGSDRRREWQGLVNHLYGSLDIDIEEGSCFRGEIVRSRVGRIELTEIKTGGETARRDRQHIARDEEDFFLFGLSLSGEACYEQYGRECVMAPQHFGLIYTAAPYLFRHREALNRICLKIPAAAIVARVPDPHALCSVAQPVEPGLSRIVADLLVSMAQQVDAMGGVALPVVEASTLDLIGLLLNASRKAASALGGSAARWAIHRRAIAFIAETLGRPGLAPEDIASGVGISTRYLHRAFERADETVVETVMRMRLERCRSMLVDPTTQLMSVKEIAHRNGFRSQSHCANVFKARFGLTPSEARQATIS